MVKFSLTGKKHSTTLRAQIMKCLRECNIKANRQNAHTFEGDAVIPKVAVEQLHVVMNLLANPPDKAHLDDLWIYVDHTKK